MNKFVSNIKSHMGIYGPALTLVFIGFIIAFQFIKPAPPDHIRIATGDPKGAYHEFASQYRASFNKQGIEVELVSTAGSVENLRLLEQGLVDIAFVQGGTREKQGKTSLTALGAMYFEPLWLFQQKTLEIHRLSELQKKRVAIGNQGSGTYALTSRFLRENGLDDQQFNSAASPSEAAAMLGRQQLDAAFFVSGPRSPLIRELFANTELDVASMDRANAYAQRNRFLTRLVLPEGVMDLQNNIPEQDIQLIATTANLVSSKDLHPAIVALLLHTATRIHGVGGWFEEKGEFPNDHYQEYPVHEAAERYFVHGAPFLQRFLPFWAAVLIDRIKVMLVPLLVLLLPLFKIMPPLYQWGMGRKIYRWYDELDELDSQLFDAAPDRREEIRQRLKKLDNDVRHIRVPASFSDRVYQLRLHINLVKQKLMD